MISWTYIWISYIALYTTISASSSIDEQINILDLSDPFKNSKFELISSINDIDLDKYYLKYSNYSITKEYNNCSIYEYNSKNFTVDQDLLDDTLAKALEIIDNIADTERIEGLGIIDKKSPDSGMHLILDTASSYVYVKLLKTYDALKNILTTSPINSIVRRLTYTSQLFWSYEVDLKVEIKQTSKTMPSYLLGRASNISGSITNDKTAKLKYHQSGYYVSLMYGDGDLCEATGLPRQTELQFVCDKDFFGINNVLFPSDYDRLQYQKFAARTLWVNEPYVCTYQVLIGVPALCDLDLFNNENDISLSKQNDKLHAYKVFCDSSEKESNHSTVNLVDDEFEAFNVGRQFVLMRHPSENVSDYLVYTDIVDSKYDIDFSMIDFPVLDYFRSDFNSVFIMRLGNTYPGPFNLNAELNEYTFYIEVFDLLGNYVATLNGQGHDDYKVSDIRIKDLNPIKNWVYDFDEE